MANVSLLPGYGSRYTSENIAGSAGTTVSADTIDTSRCAQFAVQVSAIVGSPVIQPQQTFDGTNWANLGTAIAATLGTISRYAPTSGPYGVIRFNVTNDSTSVTLTVVGFPMAWSS